MPMVKTLVRAGVVAAVVGVAGLVIVGPVRARLLVDKARDNVNSVVDGMIDDPSALRAQIRELESQYAPRIASVRTDVAQLRQQIGDLKREQAVASRVVELAQADLQTLHGMLARAQDVRETHSALTSVRYEDGQGFESATTPDVRINFNNEQLTLDQAFAKATRVEQVIASYTARQAEIDRDLGFMGEQDKRLGELLDKLEAERSEFQAQLWQLDHQIDAISRNERLITMMEKRQRTIDRQSRYEAGSLDNVKARLAEIRTKQEAQLESLGRGSTTENYENKAKIDLDARNKFSKRLPAPMPAAPKPPVIEIGPGDAAPAEPAPTKPARASTVALKK